MRLMASTVLWMWSLAAEAALPSAAPLQQAIDAYQNGRLASAVILARDALPSLSRTDRASAWMLIGYAEREQQRHNLASEAFTRVRLIEGPLQSWGAFYEAEQDLRRGREAVAAKECVLYGETYPEGVHAADCTRIQALGLVRSGQLDEAAELAELHDTEHSATPIGELIQLEAAIHRATASKSGSVASLRDLTCSFGSPQTLRRALGVLQQLREAGREDAVPPTSRSCAWRRALSMRDVGMSTRAWEAYETLYANNQDDPTFLRTLEAEAVRFGWRTHQFAELARHYERAYEAAPNGETAWMAHRAWLRAGQPDKMAAWAKLGMAQHADHRSWRRNKEDLGKGLLLAGEPLEAARVWDDLSRTRGQTGRRAEYLAAFATFKAGDTDDANERFSSIIDSPSSYKAAARYWRAHATQDHASAARDHAWILENEPQSWYALLLRQEDEGMHRNGRWAEAPTDVPVAATPWTRPTSLPVAQPVRAGQARAPRMTLTPDAFTSYLAQLSAPATGALLPVSSELRVPLPANSWVNVASADDTLDAFVEEWGEHWPVLQQVQALARGGLYDLSGPTFSAWYETTRKAARRDTLAQDVFDKTSKSMWRNISYAVGDAYHLTRVSYGLEHEGKSPSARIAGKQLELPLPYQRHVWSSAERANIDPYLIMGLMRTESLYRADAISRVGARGPMQIMPKTGGLTSDLLGHDQYMHHELFDPAHAVALGVHYLGRLIERWHGAWPLAVASYNGGPHNVNGWLGATGAAMPLDEFVEHIPFKETRGYVQKVSARYHAYAMLYDPETGGVRLGTLPDGQSAHLVDF
ncbi:MAG: transglycosylase SLT domain-containing protein [Myxococcota bacterium]